VALAAVLKGEGGEEEGEGGREGDQQQQQEQQQVGEGGSGGGLGGRRRPPLPRLQHLHLANVWASSTGATALAGAFRRGACPSLLTLDLSYNDLHR